MLTLCVALAIYPTGTVTRSVSVTTNGVLFGSDTNFAALNGLAGTGSVATVEANLTIVSNTSVSAVSSASVAQASAAAAMSTGAAAQASASSAISSNAALDSRMVAVETNHATEAQGAKADTAAQPNGTPITTNYSLAASGGASLTGDVATLVVSSRVTIAVSSPLASIDYDSTAGGSGATMEMEYWSTGGWTNECIYPCYTGSLYYAAVGPGGLGESNTTDVVASNWVVRLWGHPQNLNVFNDMRGTVLSVDAPTAPEHATTRKYVDDAVGAITPSSWAGYDANGAPTGKGGVDLAGKRLYLSPSYSILSVSSDGHWALQHNGRDVLTVQMDVQGCAISNATYDSTITISVDTNTIQSAPWPEVCTDLVAGNWTAISGYTSTNNGPFLDISFTNVWTAAYFRAMQTGTNASTLVSAVTFVAPAVIIAGTNAAWQTMDVLIPGGGTNTIRYIGTP
jgi:hypothetical protein